MRRKEIELEGLTMGIVGFGGTGHAMARRAVAFGMHVLALDEHPVPASDGVDAVWGRDRLNELLASSDVGAVCCPLTAETRQLFNDATFAHLKRGALLVNVTRGEIIDGDALARATSNASVTTCVASTWASLSLGSWTNSWDTNGTNTGVRIREQQNPRRTRTVSPR